MKALVTGGMGFIGSHLVEKLLIEKIEVVVVDNQSTGRLENISHLLKNKNLTYYDFDLAGNENILSELVRDVHYIFHLAALADIVPSIQNPEGYYHANVTGTLKMLEAAKKCKHLKKFIYSASSSCYGIPRNYPTNEKEQIDPQYPYALTKYLGEELLFHWGKLYNLPVISTRFFNVYGPRSRTSGTYGAVFGVFMAQKLNNKPFTIVGDGSQTRDFTYVTDVVDALYCLAESETNQEAFNIGSGNTYSVNLLVNLLEGEKVFIPKRPGEPDCTFADISKIKKLIGWTPKISFEEGVSRMLENIEYWKEAVVWEPQSIKKATSAWFSALEK